MSMLVWADLSRHFIYSNEAYSGQLVSDCNHLGISDSMALASASCSSEILDFRHSFVCHLCSQKYPPHCSRGEDFWPCCNLLTAFSLEIEMYSIVIEFLKVSPELVDVVFDMVPALSVICSFDQVLGPRCSQSHAPVAQDSSRRLPNSAAWPANWDDDQPNWAYIRVHIDYDSTSTNSTLKHKINSGSLRGWTAWALGRWNAMTTTLNISYASLDIYQILYVRRYKNFTININS